MELNGLADFAYTPLSSYLHVNSTPRFGREVSDQMSSERVTEPCPHPIPDVDRHNPIENARWVGYACIRPDAQKMIEDRMLLGQNATHGRSRVGFASTESIEDEARSRANRLTAASQQRKFEASAGHSL